MEGSGSSNWRPPSQGDPTMNVPEGVGSNNEWRAQLAPEARHRIVSKIMDTLKRHLPISAPEGLGELNKIAVRFEEKIYNAATSQADYLRRISMKMLTMEQKNPSAGGPNAGPPNSNIASQNSPDAANVMSSQLRHQMPSMVMPMPGQQVSTSMSPALSSITGLNQSTIGTIGQNSNMQAMPGISQNPLNNTPGQGVTPNLYANTQRQVQGRQLQQSTVPQQQQQQTNQLVYQQQLMKKMSHPSLLQTQMSQQQKSPSLLQSALPSSQPTMMQVASGLQPNQASLQNQQSSVLQSISQNAQQNQQNPAQQGSISIYQQSQPRQQQISQQSSLQQQASILQQSSSLSQQQLLSHPSNVASMQQLQFGQQNNISDLQQQQQQLQQHSRLSSQQTGLINMQQSQQTLNQQNVPMHQQQQLGTQNNASGLQQQLPQQQQQQQQPAQQLGQHQNQLFNSQSTSNVQQHLQSSHMLQHPKTSGQVQQTSNALLQMQGQQPPQQQHMAQLQPQSLQLQQQLAMQTQQTNALQREMLQRLPASAAVLQPQNVIEQQKQPLQPQRVLPEAPSTSVDSTAQTTHAGSDVQEEIYSKIKSWKEMYYTDLHEMYQRLTLKLQQHEGHVLPPGKQSDQLENLRKFKISIERLIQLLQLPKSNIHPGLKDKLPHYEKQIIGLVSSSRKRPPQGQQFQPSGVINQSIQQQPTQISHLQQPETLINPVQQMSVPTSVTTVQSNTVSSLQNVSMASTTQVGGSSTQHNMMNALQPCSNMESSQGNALNSLQQGAIGSLQQSNLGTLHQASINTQQSNCINTLMQNNVNTLQSTVNPLQQNSNVLQHQHIKQEHQQQLMQAQQIKQQFQQRQLQQQIIQQQQMIQQQQKQQILQQPPQLQQQLHQQKQIQQHALQSQPHPIQQLHQMNEINELKLKHPGLKPGMFPSHNQAGQRQTYYQPQLKSGSPFSPQNLQSQSPLMSQHSSPQVEQQAVPSHTKSGTPLQSTTPPFVVPSPSTPLAPSPLPGDHEKQTSGISSFSNAGNSGQQQSVPGQAQVQSLAVGTPGISTSPLLAELDGFQPNLSIAFPGRASSVELPLERLLKAVKSSSSSVLCSAVSDIASVVSMIDRIAGAAPGNGSRAAVGEDLVAMTKCRLQARNFMSLDSSATTRKMKRQISAMPLNAVPSAESANESLRQPLMIDTSELESTATSNLKRPRLEVSHVLLDEIRDINQQLIDTVVAVADDDMDSAPESGEGTIIKCTFCAVALSPNLKSQLASADVSPILPIRLLIPPKYPLCSPVLLDKIPTDLGESGDLSAKARSRYAVSLRGLSQKMSLEDMARTWDISAREVILEYAQQNGGGSFTSRYGVWENCVGA